MIEPFEAERYTHNSAGEKLISYGTSSYGYDVRCSREFKVFTNINSATVDQKAFDNDSFVDVESDVCVIPPNSFALARTVEYFGFEKCTDGLFEQIDLRSLRHHRQYDAPRARVGRTSH